MTRYGQRSFTVSAELTATDHVCLGIDHGEEWGRGRMGKVPPQNLEWGMLMQIVSLAFCHVSKFQAPDCSKHQRIGTKRSVLWPSEYVPRCVSGRSSSPESAGGHTPHILPSALAMHYPEFQPDLHVWAITDNNSVLCALKDCAILRNLWNTNLTALLRESLGWMNCCPNMNVLTYWVADHSACNYIELATNSNWNCEWRETINYAIIFFNILCIHITDKVTTPQAPSCHSVDITSLMYSAELIHS